MTIRPEQLVLPQKGKQVQPISITVEHRYAEAVGASLEVDGLAPIPLELHFGKQTQEVVLPVLQAAAPLCAILKVNHQEAARGQIDPPAGAPVDDLPAAPFAQ